jgi:hypothetical protein
MPPITTETRSGPGSVIASIEAITATPARAQPRRWRAPGGGLRTEDALEALLYALSLAATVGILGRILAYTPYGFDFTDESFHLVSIATPFLYDWSVTQFGFVYHPLHLLLNGHITALRRANILITFGLSWVLADTFLRVVWPAAGLGAARRLVASAGLATGSLVMFMTWLTGPSYNMLGFAALAVAATGRSPASPTACRAGSC